MYRIVFIIFAIAIIVFGLMAYDYSTSSGELTGVATSKEFYQSVHDGRSYSNYLIVVDDTPFSATRDAYTKVQEGATYRFRTRGGKIFDRMIVSAEKLKDKPKEGGEVHFHAPVENVIINQ